MATRQPGEAIDDGGLRSTYFFNGRQLTAEDLSREHNANSEALRHLGQALGEGIAGGLEVYADTGSGAQVLIEPGLAINRRGDVLRLSTQETLLLQPPEPGSRTDAASSSGFVSCDPGTAAYFSGDGIYLLTLSPTERREGFAPVSGLAQQSAACNSKYLVKGVQFRLLRLNIPIPTSETDRNRLRNQVAYEFFGTVSFDTVYSALFTKTEACYGELDTDRPTGFTECAVPLALMYIASASGAVEIRYVDMWSVRRRVTASPMAGHMPVDPYSSASGSAKYPPNWTRLSTDRRLAEGEAMLMQFQDQIAQLVEYPPTDITLADVRAADYFDTLPPLGLLPTGDDEFDADMFFGDLIYETGWLHGDELAKLMQVAQTCDPVRTDSLEQFWVYSLAESAGDDDRPHIAVFASRPVADSIPPRTINITLMPNFQEAHFVPNWQLSGSESGYPEAGVEKPSESSFVSGWLPLQLPHGMCIKTITVTGKLNGTLGEYDMFKLGLYRENLRYGMPPQLMMELPLGENIPPTVLVYENTGEIDPGNVPSPETLASFSRVDNERYLYTVWASIGTNNNVTARIYAIKIRLEQARA
jgi:hypothetical protein